MKNEKKKKNEKKHTLKKLLIFCKMELSSSKLKKLIKFQERIKKPENKKKKGYTFPYKEAKCSKLKYFLIITIKLFFSFYNIFSILNKLLLFIF